ncbi:MULTISPECIES: BTAD domain-containing putative transcriptional regulator [unclassified Amycolatopsis]|uniref:AfsR/SARP family transcriptional regulator n=1 Tax=unclassified Amycolatopsis TaxID=2618356 RepID=UPI002874712F|nr:MULTISPECIES: BTAD domain-containing putative transcriptional regulator [unclassified Amycolatopsis]MDS0136668.1 tetratricopeptide repeat protein [Amycolatopsis sp. 505]MDS0143332.1 tetratricopeptide repeat protein [Amycolatopsis sp. CM201R]
MEFRLLGPVEAAGETGAVALGGTKIRTLLAALLLEPGRVIAADRLVDIIWDDEPPPTARALIQTYVSTLRRALGDAGPEIVRTVAPGYLARFGAESLDRHRFETFTADGRSAAADGRYREASNAFRAADALWRGPALGGVRSRILAGEAARLDEQRLAVIEARIAADLALGRTDELVGELTVLVGQHPTRASLRGQLMLALYRADRAADALAVFRQGREVLIDELGIEPGVELTRLHEAILRSDPDLLGPPAEPPARPVPPARPEPVPPSPAEPRAAVPKQLPPDAADFTGRDDLVGELTGVLTGGRSGPAIAALLGPGGVGKSALAVHVAHRVSAAYPDGQLHVDLRGTTGTPASPTEVLGRFLRALQPHRTAIPDDPDERMDAYRTALAGHRVLIVLDDAANEQQVRPLLPGSGTCSVLLTSRHRLGGLAGAHLVEVGLLSAGEATALLSRIAGADRIDAAPEAAADIVACCGNLPLAVRVAGARLATRRQWTARLLATRLTDERRRLTELCAGDQQIRASIELSVRNLDPAARTALRRLGYLGLADFRSWVVAAALDTDLGTAEQVVEHLVDTHLVDYTFVDDTGQVRYRLHDLVRIYAREEAERHEPHADLVASTARVAGGWTAVLDRLRNHIADHVTSGAIPLTTAEAAPVDPEVLGTALTDPRGWLDIEQASLVLAVERAAEAGLDEPAVAIASVLCSSSYPLNSVLDLWDRAHGAALAAARAAGNTRGEAILLAQLGQLRYEQDRFADARRSFTDAVERFRDLQDPRGEAGALTALGLACRDQGYLPEAGHFLAQAAAVCRSLDDERATGHCERLTGSVHLERGDFAAADRALAAALAAYRRAGSERGEALTLRTIGLTHLGRGRLTEAEETFTRALALFRRLGDPKLVSFCLRGLAKTHLRMGRLAEARQPLETALDAHRAEGDRWGEAMVMRTLGELDLAAGRFAEAGGWLTGALEAFREQEAFLFGARTLRDIAQLEEARGDHTAAKAALAEAIETFRAYGSREYGELTAL